jgi:hypothetical protein
MENLVYVLYLSYAVGYFLIGAVMTPMQRERLAVLSAIWIFTATFAILTIAIAKDTSMILWWLLCYWLVILVVVASLRGWVDKICLVVVNNLPYLLVSLIAACAYFSYVTSRNPST